MTTLERFILLEMCGPGKKPVPTTRQMGKAVLDKTSPDQATR